MDVWGSSQALDLLRLLLDPDIMDGPAEKNSFLQLFYDQHMKRLLKTLEDGAAKDVVRYMFFHLYNMP